MSEFMGEPSLVLSGKEELLNAMEKSRNLFGEHKWLVRSDFVCDCIREIKASGKYPYNSTVWEYVREKLGLPYVRHEHEGDTLSLFVYNAQQFVRSDDLKENGYAPLTQEMVDEAFSKKMKIQTNSGRVYNVRKIGDRVYAMQPRVRTRALSVDTDTPAKIVRG